MAGRTSGPKTRCGGRWTEARFDSFIRSLLRNGTRRWGPISDALKAARIKRGFYKCAGCKQEVPASIKLEGKRVKNATVDHIEPIVNPDVGFEGYDKLINRMFCEADNLQVLCHDCHKAKTLDERERAKERRQNEK
jgi:5-methylcytosine-specific restriction endonuclease McrA